MEVPRTLRAWFVVHAAVDVLAAAPLLAAPELVLRRLGWACVDPVAARLVGAALLAIGAQSYLGRDAGVPVYRAMLRLKVIWSLAAAVSLFAAVGNGAPPAAWAFLSIFIGFAGVWVHHAIRFRQLDRAGELTEQLPDGDLPDDQGGGEP
jgi:hypothetical protein